MLRILLVLLLGVLAGPVRGQTLTFGQAAEPNSVDPHYFNGTANKSLSAHIFDRLVEQGPDVTLGPGLATRWQAVGESAWDFTLRPGVRFSDGLALAAEDVAFSVERARTLKGAVGGFGSVVRSIVRTEVVDAGTVRFHTAGPAPNLPNDLSNLAIVSRHAGDGATEDYNAGKAAVGTGPYRLVRFSPGERAELVRNELWWGAKTEWERVVFRFIPNAGARAAALLAGDVDVIDAPQPSDLPRFRGDSRFRVVTRQGLRLLFIAPDQRAETAGVTGPDGAKLAQNPLRDRRVRLALSLAINREALAGRIMQDMAAPAGQWLPPGTYSYNPAVSVPPFAPEEARRLLAEAGFPRGLQMTLSTANDVRPTDVSAAQAVGQMWTRVGVATQVATLPSAAYNARGQKGEFSLGFWSWGSNSGEAGYALVNVFSAAGGYNRAFYRNAELDALTDRALATLDDDKREELLRQAVALAMGDVAVIPLYLLQNAWVSRAGVRYEGSAHERNMAALAHRE